MEYRCRLCGSNPVLHPGVLCKACAGRMGKNNFGVAIRERLPSSSCPDGGSHHWVIDPPGGTIMLGHCKRCRETRDFYIPEDSIPITKTDKVLYTDILTLVEIED